MNARPGRASLFALLFVFACVAFSATRGLHRGLPNHYSYHQDEIAPLRALGFFERYSDPVSGFVDKYTPAAYLWYGIPARIALELRDDERARELLEMARKLGPQAWAEQFDSTVWRNMEPYAEALSDCIVAGRLAAGLAHLLIAIGAGLLARRVFGGTAGVLAAIAAGLAPYVVYYGHTMNNDAPAFAFLLLGYAALANCDSRFPRTAGLAAGVSFALAAAIKDQLAIFVAAIPLCLLYVEFRRARAGAPPSVPWSARLVAAFAFLFTYALAANLVFDLEGYRAHVEFGMSESITQQYQMADPTTAKGLLYLIIYALTFYVRACGWFGCILMSVGLWFAWKKQREYFWLWVLPALVYFVLYPLRRGVIYSRFMMPCFLPLLVLGAGATAHWLRGEGRARFLGALGVICILAIGHRGYTVNDLWERDPRFEAERWIEANVPPDRAVIYVGNHAVPPPRPRVGAPRRWAYSGDFERARTEIRALYFARMMSTNINLVVRPRYPWPIPDEVRAKMKEDGVLIVAEFGRDLYEPELAHPILADIEVFPGVMIAAGN